MSKSPPSKTVSDRIDLLLIKTSSGFGKKMKGFKKESYKESRAACALSFFSTYDN
jgi:hypothetical protein